MHGRDASRTRIGAALAVTALFAGWELYAQRSTGSLALTIDAFHIFTHVASYAVVLGALTLARRASDPDAARRLDAKGGLVVGLLMAIGGGSTLVLHLLGIDAGHIEAGAPMVVGTGIAGAVLAGACFRLLHGAHDHSASIGAQLWDLASDMATSLLAALAGGVAWLTGAAWPDIAAGLLGAIGLTAFGCWQVVEGVRALSTRFAPVVSLADWRRTRGR